MRTTIGNLQTRHELWIYPRSCACREAGNIGCTTTIKKEYEIVAHKQPPYMTAVSIMK